MEHGSSGYKGGSKHSRARFLSKCSRQDSGYDLSMNQIEILDELMNRVEEHLKCEEIIRGRTWDDPAQDATQKEKKKDQEPEHQDPGKRKKTEQAGRKHHER